ncbi:pseudouridine synthase [Weeksellaceae bacterium KMM 9724]|nr:pseudouridine synthase [Profundicola chukchiensis]MDG4949440.1 pseudouridine synthase [Profundicola chukchiensis]
MRRKNPKFDNSNSDRREDESRGSSERRNTGNRRSSGRSQDSRTKGRSFGGGDRNKRSEQPGGSDRRKSDRSGGPSRKPSFGGRKPNSNWGERKSFDRSGDNDRSSSSREGSTERRTFNKDSRDNRGSSDRKPSFDRKSSSDRSSSYERRGPSNRGDASERRGSSDRKPYSRDSRGSSDRRSSTDRPYSSDKPSSRGNKFGGNKSYGDRETDNKGSFDNKRSFDKDRSDRRPAPRGGKKFGDRKRAADSGRDFKRNLRPRRKTTEPVKEDDGLIRLNKYIANSGMCSRRQADEYIKTGVVEVNGTVITEMGFKVKPEDDVRFDGRRLTPERKTYVLLNKPKGYITTTSDERDRKTVMDLVGNATKTRIFPVGRLDRQTTGALLFTNDGYLAKKLTHPSHGVKKIYHVILDRDLHGDDMEKIRQGIHMHEGVANVDKVSYIDGKSRNEIGVEIHIGWNRVVRRIFEKLGYKVEALDRVQFAGLTKKNLKRGDWRILDEKEVNFLKMM